MSDKVELKKLKKEAELAERASDPIIGDRFPNTYSWGYRVVLALCSIEERLRAIEARLIDAQLTYVKNISSDAHILAEATQELQSDAHTQATGEATVNSDSEIS